MSSEILAFPPVFDAQRTAQLLPYPALARALEAMLGDLRAGRAIAPPRMAVPIGNGAGTLLVMPAANERWAITKLVTVHARNAARGMPSILGEVLVMGAATGRRRMVLDGPTVTGRRTAAVSLLAAQTFAPKPDGDLLIVGAGVQALSHLEAFAAGLGTRRVLLHSRTRDKAEALAAQARAGGVAAEAVESVAQALPQVSLVVTATTSHAPVLPDVDSGLWRADHFVAAVGAFRPEMCELPPQLCLQAAAQGRLLADTLAGIEDEAGDLLQAGVDWQAVTPLQEAIVNRARHAHGAGPLVFKSVGYALWDLAACVLAVEQGRLS